MSKPGNPYPTGLNFGGARATVMKDQLASLAAENARRIPCPRCDLMILPENMARHVEFVHEDDGA